MSENEQKGERIAKVLARAGLCSRREAERWIGEGRVKVNGKTLETPACTVTDKDTVVVDGKPLPDKQETQLWRFHKPAGLVTTHKDPEGRETVFDKLPPEMGRVISIGRLDLNTEGLLLLTNDGELARKLELPSTGWVRRYRVRVHGHVNAKSLEELKNGVTIEGVRYASIQASIDEGDQEKRKTNTWLMVALTEGKNREIRKVMEHMGLEVSRLIRVSYGPFQLAAMPKGAIEPVAPKTLKAQLGLGKAPQGEGRAQRKDKGWTGAPAKRPRRKPTDRTSSESKAKPEKRADWKQGTKPSGRPAEKHEGRPSGKPGRKTSGKPGGRPSGKPPGSSRKPNANRRGKA